MNKGIRCHPLCWKSFVFSCNREYIYPRRKTCTSSRLELYKLRSRAVLSILQVKYEGLWIWTCIFHIFQWGTHKNCEQASLLLLVSIFINLTFQIIMCYCGNAKWKYFTVLNMTFFSQNTSMLKNWWFSWNIKMPFM